MWCLWSRFQPPLDSFADRPQLLSDVQGATNVRSKLGFSPRTERQQHFTCTALKGLRLTAESVTQNTSTKHVATEFRLHPVRSSDSQLTKTLQTMSVTIKVLCSFGVFQTDCQFFWRNHVPSPPRCLLILGQGRKHPLPKTPWKFKSNLLSAAAWKLKRQHVVAAKPTRWGSKGLAPDDSLTRGWRTHTLCSVLQFFLYSFFYWATKQTSRKHRRQRKGWMWYRSDEEWDQLAAPPLLAQPSPAERRTSPWLFRGSHIVL